MIYDGHKRRDRPTVSQGDTVVSFRKPDVTRSAHQMPVHETGILTGMKLATGIGWQRVETMCPGDEVLTVEHGLQRLLRRDSWSASLRDSRIAAPRRVRIPANAVGNRESLTLLPHQGVLLRSELAEEALGDPYVMICAGNLLGHCGVFRLNDAEEPTLQILTFRSSQMIIGYSGVFCPSAGPSAQFEPQEAQSTYRCLTIRKDSALLQTILQDLDCKWRRRQDVRASS